MPSNLKCVNTSAVGEALSEARSLTDPDGLVVVAGSLYLVGEAKAALATGVL